MGHVDRPRYVEIWNFSITPDFLRISGPFPTKILVRKYFSKLFSWKGQDLAQADGEHQISHLGPKDLSRIGGPEHYLVYGRPNQIPNLVGKTDHNVGGLACILGLTNSHNYQET